MPKVGKPLIRIIEFDEFERMLKACTPPHEVGPITECNATRNRAIFWVLWDTGIRLAELCDLRLSNFDRDKGVIIVHGKGDKERRIALGRNALRALLLYVDRYRPSLKVLLELGNPNEDHVFLSENGFPFTRQGVRFSVTYHRESLTSTIYMGNLLPSSGHLNFLQQVSFSSIFLDAFLLAFD